MALFGKDIHHFHTETRDRVVPYEKTVNEYRAPTDESINLYKEILDKSRKNIVDELKVESCGVELVGVAFQEGIHSELIWYFHTKLNGKDINMKFNFDYHEARTLQKMGNLAYREEITKMVFEKVSQHIAAMLLQSPVLQDEMRKNMGLNQH